MKPAALERAAEQLGGAGDAIASVLGATPLARLRELFPGVPVVRVMPTVTVEVQRGVICHAPLDPELDGDAGARLLDLFGELGHLVEVPDELMDAATAVMGCSPAYLAVVVQNLAEAGAAEGLEPEQAYELVLESFAGTIELLRRYDPIEVRADGRLAGRQHRGRPRGARRRRRRRRLPGGRPRLAGADARRDARSLALTRGDIADYVAALLLRLHRPDHRQRRALLGAGSSGRSPTT